jgi:serine/threonine protein kinase
VLEAKFLANLDHTHIIKLRGMPLGGTAGMASCQELSYFLLLDKLQSTLDERMEVWCRQEEQLLNPGGIRKLFQMGTLRKRKMEFDAERLQVALDVADALEYLHEHRIIYRDLKPENIGFDFKDTVILFDFGLAKELKPGKYSETYHLTGHTGSLRFMSPVRFKNVCIYNHGFLFTL